VALIERSTHDRIGALAAPGLTGVSLAAGIAVITGSVVGFYRVRANSGSRIAEPQVMTLIQRRANHRVGARADTSLTGVRLGTGITVIAAGPICQGIILADTAHTTIGGAGVCIVTIYVPDALHAVGIELIGESIAVIVPAITTVGIPIGPFDLSRVDQRLTVVAIVS